MSVTIIAEAGVNHDGNLDKALALVTEAKVAGADVVKFQMFDAVKLDPPGPRRDMLKALQLTRHDFKAIEAHCRVVGIEFCCTPFDVESLAFLVGELKVKRIKISSGDLRNGPLLLAAAKSGCELIVSTGMADIADIDLAMEILCPAEPTIKYVTLLHCTSTYPCPTHEANLRAIPTLDQLFHNCEVGLSDHTTSINVPVAAVALGATMIEKHFTLYRHEQGPDHKTSLDPWGFKVMVEGIREIEAALGDGIKRPMPSEAAVMRVRDEREAHRCAP